MCGLTGGLTLQHFDVLREALPAMTYAIRHRGPDDEGLWFDVEAGVALGHRRLAIMDLSMQGHQPMLSASGRYVIAFNGEIYNHQALRLELQSRGHAPAWRGHSDTETLLACIEAWGLEHTLKTCVGMFAIALWDRAERVLSLARDRFGEKPLYYGWQNGVFLFASELKSMLAHPAFEHRVNRDSLALLLRYNYVPTPYSIWQGISKLTAGTSLTIRAGQTDVQPVVYWSLHDVALASTSIRRINNDEEATDALEAALSEAIAGQMVADVPLGALLSGGVDSSTVVALLQAQSSRPVKTFSIGFHEKAFDESTHAAAVARHLGTVHTTLMMGHQDILEAVTRMPDIYDEPFADSSQLPTSLLMTLARQHVTVALSGDAGDELFGGYNRFFLAIRVWNILRCLPYAVRRHIGSLLLTLSPGQWDALAGHLPSFLGLCHTGDKLYKVAEGLQSVRNFDELYLALLTKWNNAEIVVRGATHSLPLLSRPLDWLSSQDKFERMMALEAMTFLPDDILVKVDRAAMANSLETRVPFLDHRVAELACGLPLSQKIRGRKGKWLLRQVLYRHVPRELIDRPKMGFRVPVKEWLRGPLRDWAESLLAPEVLDKGGFFDTREIRGAWEQHLSGKRQFGSRLWSVLMFQAWLERQHVSI